MAPASRTSSLMLVLLSSAIVALAGSYPPNGAITIGGTKGQYPNISVALQNTARYVRLFLLGMSYVS
jgi:hypothetical protein